ncbi:uncharacterized protein EMH_0027970 [Eimeria mitis]|uniref:Reverse transcriptase/retrotransposon-derived protein RNase H-like domain-containing protein n=1 Tax=Eimeria mitis TaxID=44415 RepID=U6JTY0_9EIME|nr:uncharacterized protein EMH_0027970 [Eimeria mitis]CDJ26978.1 hypothetical protein EMH_0027970 [Eimeria mitis]
MGVKSFLSFKAGYINMESDLYVEPVHHEIILGMPSVTQWKTQMRSSDDNIEAYPRGSDASVHLSEFPTVFASSMLKGVETVPQTRRSDEACIAQALQWIPCPLKETKDIRMHSVVRVWPPAGRSVHPIELIPGSAPSFVPRYRHFSDLEEEIVLQVEELIKVRPSTSAFGHNPVLAKKWEGRWRICVEFKPPNKITVKQKFPIRRIDEFLDHLQGSAVYSAFVVAEAFFCKSRFTRKRGTRWRPSPSPTTINIFGFRVPAAGAEPGPTKVEAIQRWSIADHTRTEAQKFLWLVSYCRNFIPGFTRIAASLIDLLKKDSEFIWTVNEDGPARRLIDHPTSSPVLTLPDPDRPFLLTTNASDTVVGVMLSQQANGSEKQQIAACYSHRSTEGAKVSGS